MSTKRIAHLMIRPVRYQPSGSRGSLVNPTASSRPRPPRTATAERPRALVRMGCILNAQIRPTRTSCCADGLQPRQSNPSDAIAPARDDRDGAGGSSPRRRHGSPRFAWAVRPGTLALTRAAGGVAHLGRTTRTITEMPRAAPALPGRPNVCGCVVAAAARPELGADLELGASCTTSPPIAAPTELAGVVHQPAADRRPAAAARSWSPRSSRRSRPALPAIAGVRRDAETSRACHADTSRVSLAPHPLGITSRCSTRSARLSCRNRTEWQAV